MSSRLSTFLCSKYFVYLVLPISIVILADSAVFPPFVRNVAFLSVARQVSSGVWSAWGIGLRTSGREEIASTTMQDLSHAWVASGPVGLERLDGEDWLAQSKDCGIRRLLAQRALWNGSWEESARLSEQVLNDCPGHTFVKLELGLAYDRMERPDLAVSAFEAGGVGGWARSLAVINYLRLARSCGADVESSLRSDCLRWLNRALVLAERHVFAATRLAALTGTTPDPLAVDPEKTPLWRAPGLNDFVIEGFEELATSTGRWVESLMPLARRLVVEQSDYGRALRLYQRVIGHDPGNARAYYLAGLTSSRLGDWATARSFFQAATERSPQTANFLFAYARAESHLGNAIEAAQGYLRGLDSEPCAPEAVFYLEAHPGLMPVEAYPTATQRDSCLKQLTQRYEAENLGTFGEVVEDSAASGGAAVKGNRNFVSYGTYAPLPPGQYRVTFRLRALQPQCVFARVQDVFDQTDGSWLVELPNVSLSHMQLPANHYAILTVLTFDWPGGGKPEFPLYEACGNDVWVDWVEIAPMKRQ